MNASTGTDKLVDRDREGGLLAYGALHQDRRNLVFHATTVPLFWAGTIALAAAAPVGVLMLAVAGVGFAVAGVVAIAAALGLQGRGHARETGRPAPFRGPVDFIVRIFVEQWITFPRFVATGGFSRVWARGSQTTRRHP